MIDEKIARINELANKKKTVGLTEEELAEQKALREEYIAGFRNSLRAQLDNTVIVRPDGSRKHLRQNRTSYNGLRGGKK